MYCRTLATSVLKGCDKSPTILQAERQKESVNTMANTTINGKTTKKELVDYLRSTVKDITDGNLKSRIEYTLKGLKKDESAVAKSDLYELAKEVAREVLGIATPALAPVENSPKPKLGKKKTVEEKVEEAPVEDEAETEEDEAPAPAKKTVKKSSSKKKETPVVESTESGLTKKELPMAKIFPKEIDHEHHGKLVACPDKYHTIEEIRKALNEEGKSLIFASYWTKRHIKEYGYAQTHGVPVPRAGFPYELDTLMAVYVCDSIDRVYAISTYTEAMFSFLAEDLEPTECEGNDGEKFLMRYSAGLEYEIYEVVE